MQLTLDIFANTPPPASLSALAAVEVLASQGNVETRGAVFTRREVVDFILDLAGYTPDQPLHEKRLLDPSFGGGGDFLLPALERLLATWHFNGDGGSIFDALKDAIRAVELHRDTFQSTRRALVEYLTASGVSGSVADRLADVWLAQGDFQLAPLAGNCAGMTLDSSGISDSAQNDQPVNCIHCFTRKPKHDRHGNHPGGGNQAGKRRQFAESRHLVRLLRTRHRRRGV